MTSSIKVLIAAALLAFAVPASADFAELDPLDADSASVLDDSKIVPEWAKIAQNADNTNAWLVNAATFQVDLQTQWIGAWTKMLKQGNTTQQETYVIWDCKYSNLGFVAIKEKDPKTGKLVILKDKDIVWVPYFKSDTTLMSIGAGVMCEMLDDVIKQSKSNKK